MTEVNVVKDAKKPLTTKRKVQLGLGITLGVLLLGLFLFRFLGTTEYLATVQRVYEEGTEYRVEFTDETGAVHVAKNEDIRFPYFKLNSADVHAELHRYGKTGDLIKLRVWGFRLEWFSVFPNVVGVEFATSRSVRDRVRAERIADAILRKLKDKGVISDPKAAREEVVTAVTESLGPDH